MVDILSNYKVKEIRTDLNDPKISLICADCLIMTLTCSKRLIQS